MVTLTPLTLKAAREFVEAHHRHSVPPVGHKFSVGLSDADGALVAVGIAGRPVNRVLDAQGDTIEIYRVCTLGHENACSRLYGALCRAAGALGYRHAVTYTREDEDGASVRAAGFLRAGTTTARSWNTPTSGRVREDRDERVPRVRWVRALSTGGKS